MDQGLKWLPLLAVLLIFWRCAFGFPGGLYSKTHLQWGQASGRAFAPRAVQSSQSESPVTGISDRSQKSRLRFSNLRQYVKGGISSSHETSRTQTASVSGALTVPQDERQTSNLTSLQPQASSSSIVQNMASQLASGQSLQNQTSSSQSGSGLQSAGGFSQIVSHQRKGSTSGLLSSPGVPSLNTQESYVKLSSSPLMVSIQATTDQSSPILHISSTVESSGPLLGVSGSASRSSGDVLLLSQSTSSQKATGASTERVSSTSAGDKGSGSIYASGNGSTFPLQSSGAAVHVYSPESLSSRPSIENKGSTFTSKGTPITEQVISSGPVIIITQEGSSGSLGSPSQSVSSQYSRGSLTPSKRGSLSLGVSSKSTSDRSLYMSSTPTRSVMPLSSSSHYVPMQTGSSSRNLSSPKPQGTSALYVPSSPSKYLNVAASSPQRVSIQSGSNQNFRWPVAQVTTQTGASSQFMSSQGESSSYSGALSQPQPSTSKYSTGALKPTSTQTVSRPLTSVASSRGSSGASSQSASQGSGSAKGVFSQPAHSSPTFSKFSSSRQVYSQSTSGVDLYGKLSATSQFGSWPQKGTSPQLSQAASGSLPQSQGSLGQYYPASPSKYVNAPLASQGLASQGSGSSFRGSSQGTFSQPAHRSPTFSKFASSRVDSLSTSDADVYGKLSATSQFGSLPQKGTSQLSQAASDFNSGSLPQSQGSLGQYYPASPSKYVNAPLASQGLASQASGSSFRGSSQGTFSQPAHRSPTFSKFASSRVDSLSTSDADLYGKLSATSQFGSLPQKGTSPQLSQAASGSLAQSEGSMGQYYPASPSKYVNAPLASQGLASQGSGSSFRGSSQGTFSQPAHRSPTFSKFASSRVDSLSTSDADVYGKLSATSQFGSLPQKGTSPQLSQAASGSLAQSEGSMGQYYPASPSKYVNAPLASQGLASQGSGSSFRGSSQGTFSQPAHRSPTFSKFASSRVDSLSTSDADVYGKLSATSQFGSLPQKGTSPQLSQAASGSLPQSQGSLGQYYPASPSKYVNAPLASQGLASQGSGSSFRGSSQGTFSQPAHSSPTFSKFASSREVDSLSTSDADLYGKLSATSQFGSLPQKGTSPQLSQAASDFNSGSLPQSQGSLGQCDPASPSKYVNAPLASQGLTTQSAMESSRRGLTSTLQGVSQSGSSLALQGSGSSSMPQGARSQFVSGSPSQYSSTSLSSTQSMAGQYSPSSQKVFSMSQSPQRLEPSTSSWTQGIQSSGAALSQGNYQSQSSQVHSRYSSPLSARDSAYQGNPQALSGGSGRLVSSQGGSGSFSGIFLQSPSTSSLYTMGSPGYASLGSSQSAKGQSSSLYGSTPQTGSGAQLSSNRYSSLKGGSSAVGGSSQHASLVSPLDTKVALYSSRLSAASLSQGIQTSDTASSQSPSSAQMSTGFSSSLSTLSQNVAPVRQSGPTSEVWRRQSPLGGVRRPSRLSFQAPSDSTISGQMSERFTSHHAADSSLPSSSGLSAHLSSTGMFSGSSLTRTAQTLSEYGSQSYNQESTASVANSTPFQMVSSNYGQDASVSSQKIYRSSG